MKPHFLASVTKYAFLAVCIVFGAVAAYAGLVENWPAFVHALSGAGVAGFCYGWLTRN